MHHTHASSSARRAGKPHHHSVVTRNGDGRAKVRSDSVTYSGVKEHKHASSVNARRRVVVAAVATIALFTAAFATYGSAASRREKRRSCTAVWERMTARRLPSCTAQRLNKAGALADGPIAAACASYAWVEVACGSRHTFAARRFAVWPEGCRRHARALGVNTGALERGMISMYHEVASACAKCT